MINDRHCFECYGYDLLIDDNLKPWLVEVNASPSLATTTEADKKMKSTLIRDILEIVVPEKNFGSVQGANRQGPMKDQGDFVVLYDEAAEAEKLAAEETKNSKKGDQRNINNSRMKSWK